MQQGRWQRTVARQGSSSPKEYTTAFVGTAVSITSGIIAHAIGVDPSISFVASLVGVVISLQLNILVRTAAVRSHLEDTGEITGAILRNPDAINPIRSILSSLDAVRDEGRHGGNIIAATVLPDRATRAIATCQEELADLARGSFESSGYDFLPLNEALGRCCEKLRGVAVQGADRLTYQEVGGATRYEELQKRLLEAGIAIERIFVYDQRSEHIVRVMKHQRELAIKVYEVAKRVVPSHLIVDCAIVDRAFCGRLQVASGGAITSTYYTTNQSEIDKRIREFEELKSLAREYMV